MGSISTDKGKRTQPNTLLYSGVNFMQGNRAIIAGVIICACEGRSGLPGRVGSPALLAGSRRAAALIEAAALPAFLYRRKTMKLQDNQLQLLRHLARFNLLDYGGCLERISLPAGPALPSSCGRIMSVFI